MSDSLSDAPRSESTAASLARRALIERLQAAEVGGDELNEAVMDLVFGKPVPSGNAGEKKVLYWWDRGVGFSVALDFTRSIDTALSLVPEGLSASATRHKDGRGSAEIWRYAPEKYTGIPGGFDEEDLRRRNGSFTHQNIGAATPALALCIAALGVRDGLSSLDREAAL